MTIQLGNYMSVPKQNCHPDRSVGSGRLRSPRPSQILEFSRNSLALPIYNLHKIPIEKTQGLKPPNYLSLYGTTKVVP